MLEFIFQCFVLFHEFSYQKGYEVSHSLLLETSTISSRDLIPHPTVSDPCIGIPVSYDTVTVSSCFQAQNSYLPQRPVAASLLNNSDCMCETSIIHSYPSLSNATQSTHAVFQTAVQSSSYKTLRTKFFMQSSSYKALVSSLATKLANFTRSPVESLLITDVSKSSSHNFLSIDNKSLKTDILNSSTSQFSPSLVSEPLNTNGLESSSSPFSSSKDMLWSTDVLQSSNSFASDMIGISSKTKDSGILSSIKTAKIFVSSTDVLSMSPAPVDCQHKGTWISC